MRKRCARKLAALKQELRRRLHARPATTGKWLASVLRGHHRYYGVPLNYEQLSRFQWRVVGLWYRSLRRRSQRTRMTWERMVALARRLLPPPRIHHPYPWDRLRVKT